MKGDLTMSANMSNSYMTNKPEKNSRPSKHAVAIKEWIIQPQHPNISAPVKTRAFLYSYFIIKGFISMLAAPGGVGKSIFFLVMACSLAIGRDLLGLGEVKQRRSLIINNEDTPDEIERRLKAIIVAYRLDREEQGLIAKNILFQSGYCEKLKVAFEEVESRSVSPTRMQGELISVCQEHSVNVLFIDPFVSIHDSNENDNNAMDAVIQILRVIAEEAEVGICLAHHSRKGASSETPDDNARGASAITAAVRSNQILSKMTEKESGKYVLEDGQWPHLIRLGSGKRNYSPSSGHAEWFELKNIAIDATDWETGEDSAEWVGVPVPVELKSTERKKTGWNLERVMKFILMGQVISPFTLSGAAMETLQSVLSDTGKRITSPDTMRRRMQYFPLRGEPARRVEISGTAYECWTEKGNNNATIYYYKEI